MWNSGITGFIFSKGFCKKFFGIERKNEFRKFFYSLIAVVLMIDDMIHCLALCGFLNLVYAQTFGKAVSESL